LGEALLEAFEDFAGLGIARRDGATSAGIAALEIYFTDFETDYAAFVFAEELVFPEGGDATYFQSGAKALAGFINGDTRKTLRRGSKPPRNGLERGGGNDGGAAGHGIVGETVFGIADEDLLLEVDAEPFGSVIVIAGKTEGAGGDFAAIAGDGEGDFAEVGGIAGADEVDGWRALAIDPFAVDGIEGPGTIEDQAAGGADAGFVHGNWVERFDGVEADVDEVRGNLRRGHGESLAEEGSEKEGKGSTRRARRPQSSLRRRGEEPKRRTEEGWLKRPVLHIRMKREKKRGAARYSPYRQRLRPSAPGSLRRELIGAESATWIRTRPD